MWYYGENLEDSIGNLKYKIFVLRGETWPDDYIDTDVAYPPYYCQTCRDILAREQQQRAAAPVQQQTVVTQVHPQNIIVNGKQGNAGTLCNVSFSLGLGSNWDDLSGGTITNNSEYSSGDILINYYLVENDDENKKHLMKQVHISLLNPGVTIPVEFGSESLSNIPSGTYVPYVTVSELMANGMYAEIYKTYFGSGEIAARREYSPKSVAPKTSALKPVVQKPAENKSSQNKPEVPKPAAPKPAAKPAKQPPVTAKKCASCGSDLPAGASFCIKCGTKVQEHIFCYKCGTKLPADAAFCVTCGTKLK